MAATISGLNSSTVAAANGRRERGQVQNGGDRDSKRR